MKEIEFLKRFWGYKATDERIQHYIENRESLYKSYEGQCNLFK
jgi:hypothetical protein